MICYDSLAAAIHAAFCEDVSLTASRPVYGGDINDAARMDLSDGSRVFIKKNSMSNRSFFLTEQTGLTALRQTGTLSVPQVYGAGTDPSGFSFLLMEYIQPGEKKPDFWEQFGRGLAEMHRASAADWVPGGRFGFCEDNFIGAGGQKNTPHEHWISFYRDCRLSVQFERAASCFSPGDRAAMQRLLDHLEEYLTEPEQPSLLHGDLWGGNFLTGPDGSAWLIDPAAYVGNREADLAMTELFGGFAGAFYGAYREAWPLAPGYGERRDLYHLYHLLNHLNLFGRSYFSSVLRIVRTYG